MLPHDVESAQLAEPVSADDVLAAEQAAAEAEARAAVVEEQAVARKVPAATVLSAKEDARLAGLRARVLRQDADRYAAATRILSLHAIGERAAQHGEALAEVRKRVAEHVAEIDRHAKEARDRLRDWNAKLLDLIAEADPLGPVKPPPSGVPHASSGHVYAAGNGSPPTFQVKGTTLRPVNIADAAEVHELDSAIAAAVITTRQHDPNVRLLIFPSGLIQPFGNDVYGHTQRRLDSGEARELSLPEREAYFRGEQVRY